MNRAAGLEVDTHLRDAFDLLAQRDLEQAIVAFDAAERLGADADECCSGRWQAYMLLGDMASAWRQTDSLRERGNPDPHRFWDGSAINGRKLIVRCLHGFGDTIQMLRYLPDLLRLASQVILEVQPRLLSLVKALPLACHERLQIITWGDEAPDVAPAWEIQVESMELPYLFRTTREQLTHAPAYICVPQNQIGAVSDAMEIHRLPRVGVVWTAGEWNPDRAIGLTLMRPLFESSLEFWSLVDIRQHPNDFALMISSTLRDSSRCGEGILTLAAVISNLNLVITTDTMAAHLAGAIGVPVWVMLQYAADWRWMQGERSPWYPSMRLFRQPAPGDWGGVIQLVDKALQARWPR